MVGSWSFAFGPPAKTALRKPFLTKPIPLAIVDKDLERGTASITENERCAAERIGAQSFAAQLSKAVNSAAKVRWLKAQENPHLGRDLNHRRCRQKVFAIRMVDFLPSTSSIVHSGFERT